MMVSVGITSGGLSKSKAYTCQLYGLRVKANSVLCVQGGKWVHGRCGGMKMVTPRLSRNSACWECERRIGEAVEQETLCDDVETIREFTYPEVSHVMAMKLEF